MHHSFYKLKHRQVRTASSNHCNIVSEPIQLDTLFSKTKATLGSDPSLGQRMLEGSKECRFCVHSSQLF